MFCRFLCVTSKRCRIDGINRLKEMRFHIYAVIEMRSCQVHAQHIFMSSYKLIELNNTNFQERPSELSLVVGGSVSRRNFLLVQTTWHAQG